MGYFSIDTLFGAENDYLPENWNQSYTANHTSIEKIECEPIDKMYQQYKVDIDGVTYPKSIPLFLNKSINFECLNKSSNIKKILLWNPFFADEGYSYGTGKQTPFIKKNCPVTACELISNKSRINEADFVIVHMRNSISQFPSTRPVNQRWIFMLYESPVHSDDYTQYNGLFNLTSTYMIHSDFPSFYEAGSRLDWTKNDSFNESEDFHSFKSQFAAGIISNCGGSSKRLGYIKEMQKYIPVNIFGKCGKTCPTKHNNSMPGNCKDIIAKEYKFYLAFENSICQDYTTEKFFQTLTYNIIPVVLGGGVYDHYVAFLFR